MKKLHKCLLPCLVLLSTTACNKKNKTPDEYFSFTANGVHYDYPQETKSGFLGESKTLFAGPSSGNLGYFIVGKSFKDPTAEGGVSFNFSSENKPDKDTIILDGFNASVSIGKFLDASNNYELRQPLTGKIIFTERNSNRLTGIFQFNAYKMKVVNANWEPTDTILHITNGKFSIIPAK